MGKSQLAVLCLILCCSCTGYGYNSIYQFYQRGRTFEVPYQRTNDFSRRQWICFFLGICTTALPTYSETPNLKLVHQWNQLEFEYKTSADRQRDIDSGAFTPGVISPIDVDVYYSPTNNNNQIFVTIPRFVEGIPATLGTVTNKILDGNPLIKPYPNWSWHTHSEECYSDRIVSVFRIKVDECARLWVLDTGKIGSNQICQPQIMAFDLNTNLVVHRHQLPQDILSQPHLLVTPEVDIRDSSAGCKNTFVYMADVLGFALLVYDVANDKSWRIQDKTFYPYPSHGTYDIAGERFELMDGLLGMALSPEFPGQDRVLFYHAMSSPTENWVYTSYLRNQSLFEHDSAAMPEIFNTYPNRRSSQSAAEAIDKDGVMFFGLIHELQIACWNTRTEYGPKNIDIVASNPVTFQFPSGIKIIRNKKGQQELWIMTVRFQKVINKTLNPKETNFRIQAGKVEDLLFGTKCKSKRTHHNQVGGSGGGFGLLGGSG